MSSVPAPHIVSPNQLDAAVAILAELAAREHQAGNPAAARLLASTARLLAAALPGTERQPA